VNTEKVVMLLILVLNSHRQKLL